MMVNCTCRIDMDAAKALLEGGASAAIRWQLNKVLNEQRITAQVQLRYIGAKVAWVTATSGLRLGLIYWRDNR